MTPRLSSILLRSQSDDRLLVLARAGHEPAFAALVDRYRGPLNAFARRIVSDNRSEDVVQEAFIRAWASLESETQIEDVRAWLYTVVRNTALKAIRGDKRSGGAIPDDVPAVEDVERVVERRQRLRAVFAGLGALPGPQRQAMLMTAVDGLSGAEAASALGVTEGALHQLVHRARGTLRGAVTAVTPLPLASWAAKAPDKAAPFVDAAQLGTGAGLSLTAAKVAAVVAVTGAVAGGVAHITPSPSATPAKTTSQAARPAPHPSAFSNAALRSASTRTAPVKLGAATPREDAQHGEGDTSGASGVQSRRHQKGRQGGENGSQEHSRDTSDAPSAQGASGAQGGSGSKGPSERPPAAASPALAPDGAQGASGSQGPSSP
jgi:RNA polymerase sigma factor (sigma-70 family)